MKKLIIVVTVLVASCTMEGSYEVEEPFYYKCIDFRDNTSWVGHSSDLGEGRIGIGGPSYLEAQDTTGADRKIYPDGETEWQKCRRINE